MTGARGSGKSSTLAALLDRINEKQTCHIITIEDPIEFLHNHKQATIHQRELHSDTPNFALALRAALRQAPKVILVGELRDRETMEMVLEAAETGHLVLSSLNAPNALKTLERIVTAFRPLEQSSMRSRLAKTLRYVISQRLVPRKTAAAWPSWKFSKTLRAPRTIWSARTLPGVPAGSPEKRRLGGHAALRRGDRKTGSRRNRRLWKWRLNYATDRPATAAHPEPINRPRTFRGFERIRPGQ